MEGERGRTVPLGNVFVLCLRPNLEALLMGRSVQTQDSCQWRMEWSPQTYRSRLHRRLWREVQPRASGKPVPPSWVTLGKALTLFELQFLVL